MIFVQAGRAEIERAGDFVSSGGSGRQRVYLPGDVVHVVVGAPVDVTGIIAEMPDKVRLDLSFERRTHTWHGHWEAPYGFPKGDYYAKLIATDVEGRLFYGKTSPFYIGEPALVTMIGLDLKQEVELKQEMAPPPVVKQPEKIEAKPKPRPKPKAVVKPKPPAKKKDKPLDRARLPAGKARGKDQEVEKVRLITAARFYFKQANYQAGRDQLKTLQKLDPDNLELKTVIERLDRLMRIKESQK